MKEREADDGLGPCLYVYPHLPDDASPQEMAVAANVEARQHWGRGGREPGQWGVRLNVGYDGFMGREESERLGQELAVAVARCWQWIDEQVAALSASL